VGVYGACIENDAIRSKELEEGSSRTGGHGRVRESAFRLDERRKILCL
jgi:hypothetical protein